MKDALALVVAAIGTILSVYFGLVVMFAGGIEQVIDALNEETSNGSEIAWGILRVMFASISFGIGVFISLGLATMVADRD